jgi:hypothetical protein
MHGDIGYTNYHVDCMARSKNPAGAVSSLRSPKPACLPRARPPNARLVCGNCAGLWLWSQPVPMVGPQGQPYHLVRICVCVPKWHLG